MNRFLILLFILISNIGISQNSAPSDYTSLTISLEKSKDAFLKLCTNSLTKIDQTGWDIAFYNEVHEIGGKINDVLGVRVWRVFKDSTQFNSVVLSDTLFPAFNNDSFMYMGALDTIYKGSLAIYFNIGLGRFYTGSSYTAAADRIYIIQKSDGIFGKFYLKDYSNRKFTLVYSNMDNSGMKELTVIKESPSTKHYQYLNLTTNTVLTDYEPSFENWDLVFKQDFIQNEASGRIKYPFGILTNNAYNLIRFSNVAGLPSEYLKYGITSTEAYDATGDPLSVTYNNSLNSFEPMGRLQNQIGVKWLDLANNQVKQNRSFFVRTKTGNIVHLIFKTYNPTTNTIEIATKCIGTVGIDNPKIPETEFKLVTSLHSMNIISNENSLVNNIKISDYTGKTLYHSTFSTVFDLLGLDLPKNSILLVEVYNNKIQKTFKLQIP